MIRAIIFDLDGLLVDSEPYWEQARRDWCRQQGCDWTPQDELGVKGANSPEWAARIEQRCALSLPADQVIAGVTAHMRSLYAQHLPLLPGAVEIVRNLATGFPLAVASSSPPALIEYATAQAGIRTCFRVIVSADDTGRGKPAPDVFLAAAKRLGVPPAEIAVFEDSSAGITAGHAAGMMVLAVPNAHYPPNADALARADHVLHSLLDFEPKLLAR